jgi:hypothetical protein
MGGCFCVHAEVRDYVCFNIIDIINLLSCRKTLALAQARISEEHATKRRQFDLQEHELNLRAAEAGMMSRQEFHKTLKKWAPTPPTIDLQSSPDWDLEKMDDEMESSSEGSTNEGSTGEWD